MSKNIKLHADLASLIVAMDKHSQVFHKGRMEAPSQETMLAYRRIGGALDRLLARSKLEQELNNRKDQPG